MTVGAQEGDPVARSCCGGDQPPRQARRAVSKLLVSEALVATDDPNLVGKLLTGVAQEPNWRQGNFHTRLAVGERLSCPSQHRADAADTYDSRQTCEGVDTLQCVRNVHPEDT